MKLERRRKRARERKRAKRESESERERETARERLKKMPRSETVPVFRKLKKKNERTNERTWRVYGLYCALARTGGNW